MHAQQTSCMMVHQHSVDAGCIHVQLNPRVIGITTSIRVDFLKACFREISEPRHAISVKIEVNGVRQPELFTGASISHNR